MEAVDWGGRQGEKETVGCVGLVVEDEWSGGGNNCGLAAVKDRMDAVECGERQNE